MQIKTIAEYFSNKFDETVNKALADGWTLTNRYFSGKKEDYFVAELVKYEPEEIVAPIMESAPIVVQVKELPKAEEPLKIKVKYFDREIQELEKISVGDWVDLRSAERVELRAGQYYLIPLGVGMILPDGYEAHVLPRSSTPKKFGVIMANSMGVIDNSYSGDADEWKFPAVAIRDTIIEKGDRIAQFRLVKNQPGIEFETVAHLNEVSRGGIGSTGKR